MTAGAVEHDGDLRGDRVQVFAGGNGRIVPAVLVPALGEHAVDPRVFVHVFLDDRHHLLTALHLGEVGHQHVLAGKAHVHVGVIEPRHEHAAFAVDLLRIFRSQRTDVFIAADGFDPSVFLIDSLCERIFFDIDFCVVE